MSVFRSLPVRERLDHFKTVCRNSDLTDIRRYLFGHPRSFVHRLHRASARWPRVTARVRFFSWPRARWKGSLLKSDDVVLVLCPVAPACLTGCLDAICYLGMVWEHARYCLLKPNAVLKLEFSQNCRWHFEFASSVQHANCMIEAITAQFCC